MSRIHQIPHDKWVPADIRPLACLNMSLQDLSSRLSANFDSYEQDGLGPAHGAGFNTSNGNVFYIEFLEFANPLFSATIHYIYGQDKSLVLKDILACTGISVQELTWFADDISLS